LKSDVNVYLEVMECVYIDATMKCSADVLDLRDLETIRSRVKNEGMSFLTITLPQFAKDFERSLENGGIDPACFHGFHRRKHEAIPEFLQGMLNQIFDRKTGKVITYEPPNGVTPSEGLAPCDVPTVVESVRQICRLFNKVELDCTPKRVRSALRSFYEIEQDFKTFSVPDDETAKFLAVSRLLWGSAFRDFVPSSAIPQHGPGATADRISGNQKFLWRRWHDRLEHYFPLVDNGYPLGIPESAEELEIVTIIPEQDEQPVKVITVPKTLKSPRVIAIEPACMQYAQQGIRDYLYDRIESFWMTAKRINFRDQTINQKLALTSSKDGRLATIDLSEASDRVPLDLAIRMFDANPDLKDSILACRSTRAQLPDGQIIDPLGKFASMGSALCFPVEAMYFYTVCVVALLEASGLSYTQRNCFNVSRSVYVYGDDIIVPATNADAVLDHLRKYNCKVNTAKTFYRGSFRESCGVDAFAGYEVTPTYVRQPCPEDRRQHHSLISWCATANLFYLKGYWRTTTLMFLKLEKILGSLPYVRETASVLGRYSFLGFESGERFQFSTDPKRPSYQRLEVRGWKPSPVYRSDELDGWSALAKCLSKMEKSTPDSRFTSMAGSTADLCKAFSAKASLEDVLVSDRQHLDRSALHGAVTLKRRWAPAH